jgi:hypothetical protein
VSSSGGERTPARRQLGQLGALGLVGGPTQRLRGLILLGAQLFELGGQPTPALVELEQLAD